MKLVQRSEPVGVLRRFTWQMKALLLAAIVLLSGGTLFTSAPAYAAYPEVTIDHITYGIDTEKPELGATVWDYAGPGGAVAILGEVEIEGKRYPVTTIGWAAFSYNQISSVSIPNSVTKIDYMAFSHNQIKNLVLPDSVKDLQGRAFENNELESVTIPNSVTHLGDGAFHTNHLTSVYIPDSVTQMDESVFARNRLTRVRISPSLSRINGYVFMDNQLASVEIPNNVTRIEIMAFQNNALTHVSFGEKVDYIGSHAFNNNNLTSISIPKRIRAIDYGAFAENEELHTVTFEGDAPTLFYEAGTSWSSLGPAEGKTLIRHPLATGFTPDVWQGYTIKTTPTVSFETASGSQVDPLYPVDGGAVDEPAPPTRTGYTFTGWYTDEARTSPYDFDTLVTGDVVLYAGWDLNSYSVTWDENRLGAGIPQTDLLTTEKLGALPAPSAPELVISEWNTKQDGSGISVNADTTLAAVATGTEVALYAIWEKRTLSIAFAPGSSASSTASAGDTVTLTATANAPFGGTADVTPGTLFTSAEERDTVTNAQVLVTAAGTRVLTGSFDGATAHATLEVIAGPLGKLTLTPAPSAVEQGGAIEFTVTGVDASNNAVTINAADVVLSSDVDTDEVAGTTVTFPTAGTRTVTASVAGAGAAPVTGDVSVSPRYSVTWNENWPDAGTPTLEIITGDQLGELPDPSAAGWVITEWNTKSDGSGVSVSTGTPLESVASGPDVALYAIWAKRTLSLALSAPSVVSGSAVAVTATANSAFGRTVDVSAEMGLTSSEPGDRVTKSTVSVSAAGTRTLTGEFDGTTATAELEVTAGPIAKLTATPAATTVARGGTIEFFVDGHDAAGNPTFIDPSEVTLTSDVATDVVDGLRVTFPTASPHKITATIGSLTASVTIEVSADAVTPTPTPTPSPTPTPTPSPSPSPSPSPTPTSDPHAKPAQPTSPDQALELAITGGPANVGVGVGAALLLLAGAALTTRSRARRSRQ